MNRFIAAVAASLTMLVLVGQATAFEVSQTLDISMKSQKLKKPKKLKGKKQLNLTFAISNNTSDGSKPPPANLVEISMPDLKFNKSKFPTCSASVISSLDFSTCAKAQVGKGTATIDARPDINGGDLNAEVAVYNGKGNTLYLVINVASPAVTQVLTGTFGKGSDGFAKKLSVVLPDQRLTLYPDEFAAIHALSVTVGAVTVKKKKVFNFLEAPAKCEGGLLFSEVTTYKAGYASNNTATATDQVDFTCK